VVVGDDLEHAQALLEDPRQAFIGEALAMQYAREDFNRDLREYDAA
jgi:hypothetical protein